MTDRDLDLQLYLLLNGYPLKDIPEDRYGDYMREPHYTTSPDAMLELVGRMVKSDVDICILNIGSSYSVELRRGNEFGDGLSDTMMKAVALAVYKFFAGYDYLL